MMHANLNRANTTACASLHWTNISASVPQDTPARTVERVRYYVGCIVTTLSKLKTVSILRELFNIRLYLENNHVTACTKMGNVNQ